MKSLSTCFSLRILCVCDFFPFSVLKLIFMVFFLVTYRVSLIDLFDFFFCDYHPILHQSCWAQNCGLAEWIMIKWFLLVWWFDFTVFKNYVVCMGFNGAKASFIFIHSFANFASSLSHCICVCFCLLIVINLCVCSIFFFFVFVHFKSVITEFIHCIVI